MWMDLWCHGVEPKHTDDDRKHIVKLDFNDWQISGNAMKSENNKESEYWITKQKVCKQQSLISEHDWWLNE